MLYIIVNLIFNQYSPRIVDFRSPNTSGQEAIFYYLGAVVLLAHRNNAICGSVWPVKISSCALECFFLHGWQSFSELMFLHYCTTVFLITETWRGYEHVHWRAEARYQRAQTWRGYDYIEWHTKAQYQGTHQSRPIQGLYILEEVSQS